MSALLLALLVAAAPSVTAQEPESSLYTWGYYEAWPLPEFGGHGTLLVTWLRSGLPGGAHLELTYNTDTVLVGYRDRQLGQAPLRISVQLKGQVRFARILSDYVRRGLKVDELGFQASQVELDTRLAWDLAPHQTLELIVTGRRWFFADLPDTAEALVLPGVGFQLEPRLSWRYWCVDQRDAGTAASRFRPLGRVWGIAVGIEAGLDWRDDDTPWGGRDPTAFDPTDTRNEPRPVGTTLRQWLVAGTPLSPRWFVQARQSAAWIDGADDLSRPQLGGSAPYLVPLAGHPWAAFLSGTHVSVEAALRWGLGPDPTNTATRHELGLVIDAALLRDIERTGSDRLSATVGVGLLAELRFGRWQLETRAGYAPPLEWQADQPHLTASFGVGTEWLR